MMIVETIMNPVLEQKYGEEIEQMCGECVTVKYVNICLDVVNKAGSKFRRCMRFGRTLRLEVCLQKTNSNTYSLVFTHFWGCIECI